MNKVAVRNISRCTKDCLCLYVCPVGATDTENSIIDVSKCLGCGTCAEACPSGAISMVPLEYPPQQPKTEAVAAELRRLAQSKADGEKVARQLAEATESDGLYRLAMAVAKSERIVAEDIMREAGFMLPQSANAHRLLEALVAKAREGFPVDVARELLQRIPCNEEVDGPVEQVGPRTFRCLACGAVFEVAPGEEPVCPVCGVSGELLEVVL